MFCVFGLNFCVGSTREKSLHVKACRCSTSRLARQVFTYGGITVLCCTCQALLFRQRVV